MCDVKKVNVPGFKTEKNALKLVGGTLVTQPMSQLQPNQTELRSMDYYILIFYVDSKNVSEKCPLSTQQSPLFTLH